MYPSFMNGPVRKHHKLNEVNLESLCHLRCGPKGYISLSSWCAPPWLHGCWSSKWLHHCMAVEVANGFYGFGSPVALPGKSGPLGPKSRASFWEQHAVQHKSASPRSSSKTISSMDIGRQRSTHFYDINVKCTMLIYVVWLRRGGLTKKARHQYHNISFVDMLYLIHFPVSSAVNPLTTRAWPCVLWQTPPGCD